MTRAMAWRLGAALVLAGIAAAFAYYLGYSDGFDSGREHF